MKIFFDTSTLVASLVNVHPAHASAKSWLRRIIAGSDSGFIAAHSLAEPYSVLTTYPLRPRLTPKAVYQLLGQNVFDQFEVIALSIADYTAVIERAAASGIIGGAVYDALIVQAAVKADADQIVTLNEKDFRRIRPDLADKITAP